MLTTPESPLVRFVARLSRQSQLTAEEREAILALQYQSVTVPNRRDVVEPGDILDSATLVASGVLARFDRMADGSRQITSLYFRGDMCDLYSVPSPLAGWGLTAIGASKIALVPHAALRDLIARFPKLAIALWRDTVIDSSIMTKWISNLGRKSGEARVAHFLCETGVRLEDAGLADRGDFALEITQEQLADINGLTSVHLNRLLRSLRERGLVTVEQRHFVIPDWDALAQLAEFDPTYLMRVRQPL